jgi:ethanolamine permease
LTYFNILRYCNSSFKLNYLHLEKTQLKKALKPIHLWGIAVGLVISGEYFGWNYGWNVAGTVGMLIATLIVTVLYLTFIFSFTELTTSIPEAGGPFSYAETAFGPLGGFIAGMATLVEFLLAPPAIAFALGSYVHFLHPAFSVMEIAIASYVIFTLVNCLGIKESAIFSVVITILAVGELLLFIGIVAPHFEMKNIMANPMPFGWGGVFAALPFAIWLYIAIEGVAMVAEEVKDPQKTIPKGYIYGILTLVVLAVGVMMTTAGVGNWQMFSSIDYPLPAAIGYVLGPTSKYTQMFAGLGLFGLVASFHGIITSYGREIFALARSGFLPKRLASVNTKTRTPVWALIVGSVTGIIALFTGTTDKLITISAMGALVMYIISMAALLSLRKKQPSLERPFKVFWYPFTPIVALVLSVISLLAVCWFNVVLSIIFFAFMIVASGIFALVHKNRVIG